MSRDSTFTNRGVRPPVKMCGSARVPDRLRQELQPRVPCRVEMRSGEQELARRRG